MPTKIHVCYLFTDDGATPILEELSSGKIYFDGQRRKRRSPLPERKTAEHSRDDDVYKQFVGQAEGHRNFLRNDARYVRGDQPFLFNQSFFDCRR